MFSKIDHVIGAILVRLRRRQLKSLRKPDLSLIIPNLYIGGSTEINLLSQNNISSILDLRKENKDNHNELKKFSIDYLQIKIPDRDIPNNDQINSAISWINSNLKNNRKVFVHCNLGRGRAPLIACLYLISKGMTYTEAITHVKKRRRYTYFNQKQLKKLVPNWYYFDFDS